MDELQDIVFWHWWVLAAVLVVLELRHPVFLFLWLGFASAAIGFLQLVFPNTPSGALLALFGLLTLIALMAWHIYRRSYPRRAERERGARRQR